MNISTTYALVIRHYRLAEFREVGGKLKREVIVVVTERGAIAGVCDLPPEVSASSSHNILALSLIRNVGAGRSVTATASIRPRHRHFMDR